MLLSVYGSLRRGLELSPHTSPFSFLGYGWLSGANMYDLGPFPCIQLTEDKTCKVRVEVYDVKDSISTFDQIEGYHPRRPENSLYQRQNVTIQMDDGSTLETAVYVFPAHRRIGTERVTSGDWCEFHTVEIPQCERCDCGEMLLEGEDGLFCPDCDKDKLLSSTDADANGYYGS